MSSKLISISLLPKGLSNLKTTGLKGGIPKQVPKGLSNNSLDSINCEIQNSVCPLNVDCNLKYHQTVPARNINNVLEFEEEEEDEHKEKEINEIEANLYEDSSSSECDINFGKIPVENHINQLKQDEIYFPKELMKSIHFKKEIKKQKSSKKTNKSNKENLNENHVFFFHENRNRNIFNERENRILNYKKKTKNNYEKIIEYNKDEINLKKNAYSIIENPPTFETNDYFNLKLNTCSFINKLREIKLSYLINKGISQKQFKPLIPYLKSGLNEYERKKFWNEYIIMSNYQLDFFDYDKFSNKTIKASLQIEKDIKRTFYEEHKFFENTEVEKQLYRVLNAYANLDPSIGYSQGMNIIVGEILLVLNEKVK